MITIFKCGDEIVNKHSQNWQKHWGHTFGDFIPSKDDIIELGAWDSTEPDKFPDRKMKLYKVISRKFSAEETYNNAYTNQTCVIELKEIKQETELKESNSFLDRNVIE